MDSFKMLKKKQQVHLSCFDTLGHVNVDIAMYSSLFCLHFKTFRTFRSPLSGTGTKSVKLAGDAQNNWGKALYHASCPTFTFQHLSVPHPEPNTEVSCSLYQKHIFPSQFTRSVTKNTIKLKTPGEIGEVRQGIFKQVNSGTRHHPGKFPPPEYASILAEQTDKNSQPHNFLSQHILNYTGMRVRLPKTPTLTKTHRYTD